MVGNQWTTDKNATPGKTYIEISYLNKTWQRPGAIANEAARHRSATVMISKLTILGSSSHMTWQCTRHLPQHPLVTQNIKSFYPFSMPLAVEIQHVGHRSAQISPVCGCLFWNLSQKSMDCLEGNRENLPATVNWESWNRWWVPISHDTVIFCSHYSCCGVNARPIN